MASAVPVAAVQDCFPLKVVGPVWFGVTSRARLFEASTHPSAQPDAGCGFACPHYASSLTPGPLLEYG